ncbi:MAG: hypothetical protein APR63_05015 [Desulfuromonas sp. SDB]|nr:MAG: hypothetical protein APR63_05015 [Desulfuromonas sp. SDB]
MWVGTTGLLVISLIKNKKKTFAALKIATKKFIAILFLFLLVLAGFALIVTFISPELLQRYIGVESGIKGIALSLGLGSISVMPGFAAFPLCAALRGQGIPYYIIAAFSLALMNVGIVTFPIEKKFLGFTVALIRNLIALVVCVIGVIVVKIVFGE